MNQQTFTLVWLAGIVALFYFMILRPQQQRTKKQKEMQEALRVGDKVVTIGGMHGTVKALDDETMTLEVSSNTTVVFVRAALAEVLTPKAKTED
jgi:preprotein translocase subunit YajC